MIVSKSRNFIFVHVPKTGGTSVSHILKPYRCWQEKYLIGRVLRRVSNGYSFDGHTHAPLVAARNRLSENKFSSMLKFAVVRHPVDWNVSMYRWVLKWRGQRLIAPVYSDATNIQTFEDYLMWRIKHGVLPQLTQLVDYDGCLLVDQVCRLETLEIDIAKVFTHLGIESSVPLLNVNAGERYRPTEQEVDLVMEYFPDDFKAFGYTRYSTNSDFHLQKDQIYTNVGYILEKNGADLFDPWSV